MMTQPQPPARVASPFFDKIVTTELVQEHMISLAAGLVGAVQLKGLLNPAQCASFISSLPTTDLGSFDKARYQVPTFHFGPIINHFLPIGQLTDDYWRQAALANEYWESNSDDNLRNRCLAQIEAAWRAPARPATTVDDREVYWGMVRENSHGAPPHWDEIVREFPGSFFSERPMIQLVFNLYLAMPTEGGETTIWSRRWRPRDEEYRVGSCWPNLALDEDSLTIKAEPGDALLFDPRNYHSVSPSTGGSRFALAFYIGITSNGQLRVWS